MNKKLLTIAVGAALAAASGIAAADVSWYGKANVSIVGGDTGYFTDTDDDGIVDTEIDDTLDLNGGGSRIGINASEDLGNGITVKYWHEWAIETADGAGEDQGANSGQFGHRDNLLSFNGDFGSIGAGDMALPSKVIGAGKLDLFGDTVGDANALFAQPAGPHIRYGNSFGDVAITLAYGPDNLTEDRSYTDGNLIYSSGAIAAGIGFHSAGDSRLGSVGAGSITNLFLTYSMDSLKVLAGYETTSDRGAVDSGIDGTGFTLGATYGIGGGNTLLAQYSSLDVDEDGGADLTALGFEHDFSKSVKVGVHYATRSPQGDGDDVSKYDVGATINF